MEKIITILVMMLLISTAAISIANESNIENKLSEELNEEIENDIAFSKALFPNIPRILNMDWNYWVNKPNLFLIPTGNVGIGTENPTEKLDVDGNVKVTGFKMNTGATDGFVLTSDANGVGSWQQGTPGPQGPPGEGDGHSLDSMDGSLIDVVYVNDEGHVGIGTTDPIADLEIENGGNTFLLIDELSGFSWTGLRFDRNNIEKWFIGMSNTDNNLLIRRTASNNDMVINTVGNVGIGTIEPDEKLHVSGGYIKTDSGYGYKLEHDNGYSSEIESISDQLWISNSAGGEIDFLTGETPGNVNSKMTIYPSGVIHLWGNVGLKTYNPEYELDVNGDVQAQAYHTGDIYFQKDGEELWRMFEDENGLYLESLLDGKVYRFVLEENDETETLNQRIENLESRITELESILN